MVCNVVSNVSYLADLYLFLPPYFRRVVFCFLCFVLCGVTYIVRVARQGTQESAARGIPQLDRGVITTACELTTSGRVRNRQNLTRHFFIYFIIFFFCCARVYVEGRQRFFLFVCLF